MKFSIMQSVTRYSILPVLLLTLLMSCQQGKDKYTTKEVESLKIHQQDDANTIKLNNGEKWKVDDGMMVHLRNMEGAIAKLENPSESECKALAIQLQQHLDLLTSNCTMQGEAHDELHKWLLPFIEQVDLFSSAKPSEEVKIEVSKLQESFVEFNKYFQ